MTIKTVAGAGLSFIPKTRHHEGFGPDSALVTGTYDVASFDLSLFDAYSVSQPANIARMATKRRAEFLAGRIFARLAAKELGVPAFDVPVGPERAPVWPSDITGSISHSRGRCGCLLTRQAACLCGMDIERIAEGTALVAILEKCLRQPERDWIERHAPSQPVFATLLFSAKETIFKAFSGVVGGYFGFECAELLGHEADNGLRFQLTETLHPTLPKGRELTVQYEHTSEFVTTWMLCADPRVKE